MRPFCVPSIATRVVHYFRESEPCAGVRRIVVPAAPFSAVGGTCATAPFPIAPGNSCTIIYGFAPTQPGTFAQ